MTDPLVDRDASLTDAQTCDAFVARVFGDDRARYETFVATVSEAIPANVSVIVRGSSVTGVRDSDGAPFDADGPGTSDVDLTFVGGDMVKLYESFHIPGVHSVPMGEDHPDAAPALLPLRKRLCELAGRAVNIQATTDLVQFVRDVSMNQPYLLLIERRDNGDSTDVATVSPDDAERAPVPEAGPLPTLGPL